MRECIPLLSLFWVIFTGIGVRLFDFEKGRETDRSMHHKFCLIDVLTEVERKKDQRDLEGVVIAGSLNWTTNVGFHFCHCLKM